MLVSVVQFNVFCAEWTRRVEGTYQQSALDAAYNNEQADQLASILTVRVEDGPLVEMDDVNFHTTGKVPGMAGPTPSHRRGHPLTRHKHVKSSSISNLLGAVIADMEIK
jgi:hypothetical protein